MPTVKKILFSRLLRKESTASEKIAWELLRDRKLLGLKFRRQHVIRGYVVDFYCFDLKLVVEIDGKIHENQREYDALRQNLIESEGLSFIRITTEEVLASPTLLSNKIKAFCATRKL